MYSELKKWPWQVSRDWVILLAREDDSDYLSETVGKWFKEVRIVDCSENDILNEISFFPEIIVKIIEIHVNEAKISISWLKIGDPDLRVLFLFLRFDF